MNLLLTNDDGIQAEGLHELARIAGNLGEVYVAAPDRPRSAVSHAITVGAALTVAEERNFPAPCARAWSIGGTPADCVRLALEELLPEMPGLIVSGINNGPNYGLDILYSGTVAGAMEGHLYGIPAAACSLDGGDFRVCRKFLASLLKEIAGGDAAVLWNLNLPSCDPWEYRGTVFAPLSRRSLYPCRYTPEPGPGGIRRFFPVSAPENWAEPGTDIDLVSLGYCAATPLTESMQAPGKFRVPGERD